MHLLKPIVVLLVVVGVLIIETNMKLHEPLVRWNSRITIKNELTKSVQDSFQNQINLSRAISLKTMFVTKRGGRQFSILVDQLKEAGWKRVKNCREGVLIVVSGNLEYNKYRNCTVNAVINSIGVSAVSWTKQILWMKRFASDFGCDLNDVGIGPLVYNRRSIVECKMLTKQIRTREHSSTEGNKWLQFVGSSNRLAKWKEFSKKSFIQNTFPCPYKKASKGAIIAEKIEKAVDFQLRVYGLVASAKPLVLYYRDGCVLGYKQVAHFPVSPFVSFRFLQNLLVSRGVNFEMDGFRARIKQVINFVFQSFRFRLVPQRRAFHLFSVDFDIKFNGDLYFAQADFLPALPQLLSASEASIWVDMVNLVLLVQSRDQDIVNADLLDKSNNLNWTMIFNELEELKTGRLFNPCDTLQKTSSEMSKKHINIRTYAREINDISPTEWRFIGPVDSKEKKPRNQRIDALKSSRFEQNLGKASIEHELESLGKDTTSIPSQREGKVQTLQKHASFNSARKRADRERNVTTPTMEKAVINVATIGEGRARANRSVSKTSSSKRMDLDKKLYISSVKTKSSNRSVTSNSNRSTQSSIRLKSQKMLSIDQILKKVISKTQKYKPAGERGTKRNFVSLRKRKKRSFYPMPSLAEKNNQASKQFNLSEKDSTNQRSLKIDQPTRKNESFNGRNGSFYNRSVIPESQHLKLVSNKEFWNTSFLSSKNSFFKKPDIHDKANAQKKVTKPKSSLRKGLVSGDEYDGNFVLDMNETNKYYSKQNSSPFSSASGRNETRIEYKTSSSKEQKMLQTSMQNSSITPIRESYDLSSKLEVNESLSQSNSSSLAKYILQEDKVLTRVVNTTERGSNRQMKNESKTLDFKTEYRNVDLIDDNEQFNINKSS